MDDPLNLGEYYNCYNETPYGYYLNTIDEVYQKCFYSCETCEIKGYNDYHNCIKCKAEYIFEINFNNYTNCYPNCLNYFYFDNNNNYHCTQNLTCPPEYPHLIQNKNKCVIDEIKLIKNFIDDLLNYETNNTNEEQIKEKEINKYNKIQKKIESILTYDIFDLTDIDNGEDKVIYANKILITFTNIENQKNILNLT